MWKAELKSSVSSQEAVALTLTPPADAPVGQYKLSLKHKEEELLVKMTLLFNPWCPGMCTLRTVIHYTLT